LPGTAEVQGSIRFRGDEVLKMSPDRIREMRGALVSMVFQDPMTSFNPVLRIGDQIAEAIAIHDRTGRASLGERVAGLLARVGIADPKARARAYPHEFSGGMRQRALTAMAVANGPALLIADEPTTALDVTVQDQILRLMRDLNEQSGTAILLITHNIAVVASLCRRLIVMYAGRVV
jgi:ABC-type dipeptide/oligopeptide/nickel transport system ATPase component